MSQTKNPESTRPALLTAVRAATQRLHDTHARLYTDGHQVRWLVQPRPGWFRINAVAIKPTARVAA